MAEASEIHISIGVCMKRKFAFYLIGFVAIGSGHAADLDAPAFAKACPAASVWTKAAEARIHATHPDDRAPTDMALTKELGARFDADQKARDAIADAKVSHGPMVDKMIAIDKDNLTWLKTIVNRDGFPTQAAVGREGVSHAWLLTQHADTDPAFQTRVLQLLKPRVSAGEIRKDEFAYLTDRVLVNTGKSQRYGSQFGADKNGHRILRPVEDETHLDERRASMDMLPIADYRCMMDYIYGAG